MINFKNNMLLIYLSILFINCDTKKNKKRIANENKETIQYFEKNEIESGQEVNKDTVNGMHLTKEDSIKPPSVYNFTFYLPTELEEWYNKNINEGKPSKKWIIGQFYSHPTLKSSKIGELLAYFNPEINNFVLQFASIDGTIKNELTEIGDWGYGLHINVIEVTDKFVKIPTTNFNKSAWLHFNKDTDHIKNVIFGHHSSYVQQLVRLPKISVTTITTNEQVFIEQGVFYIEHYSNGSFTIRKEIAEDMPCGDEIDSKTDKKSLKSYLLKINDLIDKNGNYRIKLAYTRGC